VGLWEESPFGRFADVMTESAEGVRTLLAPCDVVRDYVAATYRFDTTLVVPVAVSRDPDELRIDAGALQATLRVGARTGVGRALRLVPPPLARSVAWASLVDPVARLAMPGVRTRGPAGGERREWYGAVDVHAIATVDAAWGGDRLGVLADVWPPVRFGFGSVPRRPALVELTTTVEVTGNDPRSRG
jgi:hypothetical protein